MQDKFPQNRNSNKGEKGIGRDSKSTLAELTAINRKLKRKIFDLYTVFEISRNFNAVHDFLQLLDGFIYTCLGQVGGLFGAIFLKPDSRGDRFHLTKAKGSGGCHGSDLYFQDGTELLDYITRRNRPVPVDELLGDISGEREKEILGAFTGGILVPLIFQTRLSGIFIMGEKMSGKTYQQADNEFLSILGNQIAVAIENARLYEAERMATRQLREAQQQLLQTERLAALGEMSAKVAHEVNNPLGIIKNYLLLLEQGEEDGQKGKEYFRIVGQEIDRIAQIVRQLLSFHRPHEIALSRLDVEMTILEILGFMERPLISDKVELIRELSGLKPIVLGDEQSLKQVFLNLLINARDAMPDGGRLIVRTKVEGDNLVISFLDNGPGISPQVIPRIFEPFFSTKEPGKGTGLGLSVCYGIIKHHRGSITFNNVEAGGCFRISLPLAPTGTHDDDD